MESHHTPGPINNLDVSVNNRLLIMQFSLLPWLPYTYLMHVHSEENDMHTYIIHCTLLEVTVQTICCAVQTKRFGFVFVHQMSHELLTSCGLICLSYLRGKNGAVLARMRNNLELTR